jgi:hypothetical protein
VEITEKETEDRMAEHCNELQINHASRLAAVEASARSAHHRIDEVYENQKILMEMNGNIKILAEQNKNQNQKIDKIEKDVSSLKDKPAKKWESLTDSIMISLASGIVGMVITLLMKK